jgi:hypothetical protein
MKAYRITLLLILICSNGHSQYLFPVKFDGCVTEMFALESDSLNAKIDNDEMISVLREGMDKKIAQKLKGILTLQIIVDTMGNSCLISLKNETNINVKKLNLKETIDRNLFWALPSKKVAAIIMLGFKDGEVKIKRLGINAKKGVHELNNEALDL